MLAEVLSLGAKVVAEQIKGDSVYNMYKAFVGR
jgi:hypothetical protein